MKKVMRMWENKGGDIKSKNERGKLKSNLKTEADDFYVFIYDEDEKHR